MLILTWLRLLWAMIKGTQQDPHFRALVATVAVLLAVGTAFFSLNQGWSVIDSFYFSVTTLTTVGYGDLAPTGDGGRLAAVVFQLTGIGLIVLLVAELTQRGARHRPRGPNELDEASGAAD